MKLLAVASEYYPLVKTGGLADVTGALPAALSTHGIEVRTLIPGYRSVLAAIPRARTLHKLQLMGAPARIRAATVAPGGTRAAPLGSGHPVLILDAPQLYDRDGGPYGFSDDPQRFAALAQAAVAIAHGALDPWRPDLIHAHDWQTGLLPAYLNYDPRPHPPTVFTIHNLAFPGWSPPGLLQTLGLPPESFDIEGVEFYGGIGFLKAGLRFADRITTVSPTYAAEITLPENGHGLDGLLRTRSADLHGIPNGIDTTVWNPAKDPLLPARFRGPHARRRGRNKAALQARFALAPTPDTLLFGLISRLTTQKGIDLILEALPTLLDLGAQLIALGAGEPSFESELRDAAARHPGRVAALIGYDESTAHLIQAGSDAILVPSRFEPCGLTQLCALHYGAVPVVARVGGLADTVIDANPAALSANVANGLQFLPVSTEGLAAALRRTADLWADQPAWTNLQRNGMRAKVGWAGPSAAYAKIFRSLLVNF